MIAGTEPAADVVVVFCPACGARYVVDATFQLTEQAVFVLCTACGRGSELGSNEAHGRPSTTDTMSGAVAEANWPRVIVGHEVPAAARSIADALRRGGLSPVCVRTGDEVLAAVDPTMPAPPAAVVIDVGIPGVLAFEIVEAIRAFSSTSAVPVILLASVYEKTRYKRRPNRLYGADAYLELHHVPDRLVEVVRSLIDQQEPAGERQQTPIDRARAAGLRTDHPDATQPEGARSLARRLLSDVALYHGDEVARGIRRGDPFTELADAIDAARDLHGRAGGSPSVFNDELQAFSGRLIDAKGLAGRSLG